MTLTPSMSEMTRIELAADTEATRWR